MDARIHTPDPQSEYATDERCHILELLNAPDDAAVSVARARVAAGVTTRWHRLRDTAERYVILEGSGRVEIADLPATTVQAGDVVSIPPLCPQRIANTGATDLVFLAICTPRFRPENYLDAEEHPATGRGTG
ncbi:MAG TPA: cupin domain-containing protein [Stenotrophobium sp.]|jgi:mannose-6-phosphate isomerase-like protein (cupin superfamily)|nr:cupin domain-containing protein [Stenotrophobium sp.]